MSMISAQIDELRELADFYDALQKPANVRDRDEARIFAEYAKRLTLAKEVDNGA